MRFKAGARQYVRKNSPEPRERRNWGAGKQKGTSCSGIKSAPMFARDGPETIAELWLTGQASINTPATTGGAR
jgi:hypothetical protein